MSTVTAHALIGKAHPNHGGISPTHVIYLNENFRPVLTLMDQDLPPRHRRSIESAVWIPSVDHMLEDLILMAGLFVIRDPELCLSATPTLKTNGVQPVWMNKIGDAESFEPLYALGRKIHTDHKIQLVVSKDSTLYSQLPILNEYQIDVEIYTPVYQREFSQWDGRSL